MVVYIENPIDLTKILLDLINEFGKTVGYKVNIQKSKAFLYNNNEISETEIGEKSHLLSNKKNKILRNKLNQGGKRPVLRNYTTLKKQIKEDTNQCTMFIDWKTYHHQNVNTTKRNV